MIVYLHGFISSPASNKARTLRDYMQVRGLGARFACPACGAEHQPVHDTLQRQWRHLNFFQFQAYIHAKVPRVRS